MNEWGKLMKPSGPVRGSDVACGSGVLGMERGWGSGVRRAALVMASALAVVAAGTLPGASAAGEATVTVHGSDLAGLVQTRLNVVGCASVFGRSGQPPRTAIGIAPSGPAGKRSLALTTVAGDAAGPISYASSLASTPAAAISVHAEQPTTGVGYVGYQAPADVGTNRMWVGRTDLAVPGGEWREVSLAGATFTWIQYDMGTRAQLAGPVATMPVAEFTASQGGDGYGFYTLGFGCEGHEFNTDAWRIGAGGGTTTYDFEGYDAAVSGGAPATIDRGGSVTVSAQITSDGPAPRLVLEAKNADGEWGAAPQQPPPGSTSVAVSPTETTTYRWKIYSTPMVEAVKGRDESASFTVTVVEPSPTPEPEATAPDRSREKEKATDAKAPTPAGPEPAASTAPAAPAAPEPAAPEPAAPEPAAPEPAAPEPAPATPEAPAQETSAPAAPETSPEPAAPAETPAG